MKISSSALARLLSTWSTGSGPAHKRLADFIRMLVLDGRLPLGVSMPGERDLADALGVSRTTVSTAYAELRQLGYLHSKERSRSVTRVPDPSGVPAPHAGGPSLIDFSSAAVSAPGERLYRAYAAAQDRLPHHLPGYGYSSPGLPELREVIASRYAQRGLPTRADQIMVTNGAVHALTLVAGLLLRPRHRAVVEHPTYPHAMNLLRGRRAGILPVALTEAGWDLDALTAAAGHAELAYLQPDFNNPTGLLLADEDRARARLSCTVVVDETMSELALDGVTALPFAAHHADAITIGSASKTLWGGLRIGWIRADTSLIDRLSRSRSTTDLGTPIIEQLVTAELLREVDAIVAERAAVLREQRSQLLDSLREHLPDWSVWPSVGGLSVWMRLPDRLSSALAALAPRFGVELAAGPRFGVGGVFERHLRLPYTHDTATIARGVSALKSAWDALESGDRGQSETARVL